MAACLAHILPLVYHCLNSWQVVQWIWIILDSQMNHSQRHTVHTQAYCHKKNEERNKPKRIHIHTVGQWFSTTRPWPGTGLYCACNWAAKMLCDKGRQLLQKKTQLCAGCSALISNDLCFYNGGPVTLLPAVTFWKLLKCIWKRICLVCTLRLSNVLCKRPLKYTSIRVNYMSLLRIVASCCVHASKAKGWMCCSWLTFTTLGSWAPMSNPSIDQKHNETMNLTSLFLSAHCKWPLQT